MEQGFLQILATRQMNKKFGTDSRAELGYGTLNPKFHKPRMGNSSFPYFDEDKYADEDFEDEDTENAIGKKLDNYQKSDFFAYKSSNPFYFAAGNTKLSDCFYRTDKVLLEVEALGDSMFPIPSSKKNYSSGYATHTKSKKYDRPGTKRGYFSAPPPVNFFDVEDDDMEEFYGINDFSEILNKRSGE